MGLLKEVRERRLIAYLGAYLLTGFVALEGVDQLISHEILPAVAYPIALVCYVFGMLGSLTFAWYHGEKGRQETTKGEVAIHLTLFIGALATSAYVFTNQRQADELALAAEASGLEPTNIAVLYFEDLSPGGELEPVADGLTEALIERLSDVRSLDVISRNGVAPYRGASLPVDSVAQALDVGSLIQGTVERSGDRLRVTARLVDGFSGADIERTSFEIPSGDFLAARDTVVESVSRLLRQRLGEEIQLRQRQTETSSMDAWTLVQRAERLRRDAEDLRDHGDLDDALARLTAADSLLAAAEAADPSWVEPPEMRAHAASRRAFFVASGLGDFERATEEIRIGLDHAERAMDLSPNDPRVLEERGTLKYLLYLLDVTPDHDDAEQLLNDAQADLEAAVEADPGLASAFGRLSHLFYQRQDNISVVLAARRAYEEDAYLRDADLIIRRLFDGHYDLEQFSDAERWCLEGARRFSDNYYFITCQLWLGAAPTGDASVADAWALKARLDSLAPPPLRGKLDRQGNLLVGGTLMKAGMADSAEAMFLRGRADEEIDPLQELVVEEAALRATTGDPDGAMQLLRLYVSANPQHSFEAGGSLHWWWRGLRDQPGFSSLLGSDR